MKQKAVKQSDNVVACDSGFAAIRGGDNLRQAHSRTRRDSRRADEEIFTSVKETEQAA